MINNSNGIKIYFSSCSYSLAEEYKEMCPNDELNILCSHGICDSKYLNMNDKKRSIINSLICDSGTFSLNNSNANKSKKKPKKKPKKITINGYIALAKSLSKYVDFFLNFDTNFTLNGFKDNYKNMKILEENGIKVVPVVHDYLSENFDEIAVYLKEKHPIIALGASPHKKDKKNMFKNISHAVNRIVDGGAKVHLLGVTDPEILRYMPVHYCDSTSYATEQKYGVVKWWNPYYNKTDSIYMLDRVGSEFRKPDHIGNYQNYNHFEEFLSSLGLTIFNIIGHRKTAYRKMVNMKYFITMQDIIREEHKQRGFKMD